MHCATEDGAYRDCAKEAQSSAPLSYQCHIVICNYCFRWAPPGLAPQASTSAPAAAAASTSRHPSLSSQAADSNNWQTVKTAGSKAKGRGQGASREAALGSRAAPAYASSSPLDFQEPWRDEPGSSGHQAGNKGSSRQRQQQHNQKPVAMAAVSEDELPDDWEEAASAADAADEGAEEGATDSVPAQEVEAKLAVAGGPENGPASADENGEYVPAAPEQPEAAAEGESDDAAAAAKESDYAAQQAQGPAPHQCIENKPASGTGEGFRLQSAAQEDSHAVSEAGTDKASHLCLQSQLANAPETPGFSESSDEVPAMASQVTGTDLAAECANGVSEAPRHSAEAHLSSDGPLGAVPEQMGQGEQRAAALDCMMKDHPVQSTSDDFADSPHHLLEDIVWKPDTEGRTVPECGQGELDHHSEKEVLDTVDGAARCEREIQVLISVSEGCAVDLCQLNIKVL